MQGKKLNKGWELRQEPLSCDINKAGKISEKEEEWIKATVPGDVHIDLLREGMINEPLEGLNSFESEWIESKSWWYMKKFQTSENWLSAEKIELEMNGLDAMADVVLNNVHIGKHISTFRPFIYDIKDLLKNKGQENTLLVRLTSGLEYFSEKDISFLAPYINIEKGNRGDKRRVYVRKPQYSFGWDWSPRVPTCGITGDVIIRPIKKGIIRDVSVDSHLSSDHKEAILEFNINLESTDWIGTQEGQINIEITDQLDNVLYCKKDVFLRSGNNLFQMEMKISNPNLWWPNNLGDQYRYYIYVNAEIDNEKIFYPEFRYGIRKVELDQSKLNSEERLFAFKINDVLTYCRGANWIPADAIYGRIKEQKYKQLVEEAREANFNMLRVWGGGLYERDCFFEYCDQEGIMVWHDFMFACGAYPDHEQWFREEIKKEAEYQTKRLSNHASLVMWCGNNENSWGFLDWWQKETKGGVQIYNNILPQIVNRNAPDIPYWNGSPYGGESPNTSKMGDRHHWHQCMMHPDIEKRITPREYDKVDPKFISEYGYIGPGPKESILKYLAGAPFETNGEAWQHHNNRFEKGTVLAGINKHYTSKENLTTDEYLLLAGLCQGLMYEYSLDSFRFNSNCSGALFWMYNDCWGEVGWSIVDYYLNRKISYHFVRRANKARRIIIRQFNNEIKVKVANNSPEKYTDLLEYGYISFNGKKQDIKQREVKITAHNKKTVVSLSTGEYDLLKGCIFARFKDNQKIDTCIFKAAEFKKLQVQQPNISIDNFQSSAQKTSFSVQADKYAHALHFNLGPNYKLSDEYFDLLPRERKKIIISGTELNKKELQPTSIFQTLYN
ncbi:MAG: glycoside hydrolase family 2 protein [bacterium]